MVNTRYILHNRVLAQRLLSKEAPETGTETVNWKQALKEHYTGSLEQGFKQFRMGLALFFLGMVILFSASQLLEPSLSQELAVLTGLIIGGAGFIWAMMAHLRMLIGRLIRFFGNR